MSDPRAALSAAYAGKRAIVTGARGYVGANVAARLAQAGARVVRVTRSPLAPTAGFEDVIGDIGDTALWQRVLPGADVVFHFAAQTSGYMADRDPPADLIVNVAASLQLFESCRRLAPEAVVVLAGAATQAGLTDSLPVTEQHRDLPLTIYDLHKQMAESHLLHYARRGWLRGACLRIPNTFGPGPDVGAAERGVLNKVIRRALAGQPITVYGTGEYLRDYVFIDDLADAFLYAGAHGDAVTGRHFFLGSGIGRTLAQAFTAAAAAAARRCGITAPVTNVPWPEGMSSIEFRNFVADPAAFHQATGWQPQTAFESGLDITADFFSQHTDEGRT